MDKPLTLLSVLGRRLDAGLSTRRWQRWRPSVAALQQPDLPVARYHLLELPGEAELGQMVAADLLELQPNLDLRRHPLPIQDAWNFEQVYGALHDLARALAIDPSQERLLVNVTTGTHVMQICLFLLVEARYLPGELLQLSPPTKQGRPGSWSSVDLDLARYDQLAQRFRREAQQGSSLLKDGIHTRNPNFNQLIDQLERIAGHSRDPILLEGATGVGKTQLAKRLVELKRQRGQLAGRFVELNCATLRGDGAISALFGHVRGAFTGAEKAREGLLRAAHGGLLFLDEIGELGLDEQAMLLRALEEGRFLPVGADQEVHSDFQLVAGTNRDLNAAVHAGRFREDLLARIDQWRFRLPSLAERREDIEPNLDWSLERWCERHGQAVRFNQEGRRAYLEFALAPTSTWQRNFRDLNASVARLATLSSNGRIGPADVAVESERLQRDWQLSGVTHNATTNAAPMARPGATQNVLQTLTQNATPNTRPDARSNAPSATVLNEAATYAPSSSPRPATDYSPDLLLLEVLGPQRLARIDRFDQPQLALAIHACREAPSLSAAGRFLFQASRDQKSSRNDADRLRKYLARFDLSFEQLKGR